MPDSRARKSYIGAPLRLLAAILEVNKALLDGIALPSPIFTRFSFWRNTPQVKFASLATDPTRDPLSPPQQRLCWLFPVLDKTLRARKAYERRQRRRLLVNQWLAVGHRAPRDQDLEKVSLKEKELIALRKGGQSQPPRPALRSLTVWSPLLPDRHCEKLALFDLSHLPRLSTALSPALLAPLRRLRHHKEPVGEDLKRPSLAAASGSKARRCVGHEAGAQGQHLGKLRDLPDLALQHGMAVELLQEHVAQCGGPSAEADAEESEAEAQRIRISKRTLKG